MFFNNEFSVKYLPFIRKFCNIVDGMTLHINDKNE